MQRLRSLRGSKKKSDAKPSQVACPDNWIRLNVGGTLFVTSKQTLSKEDGSFLARLCSTEDMKPGDTDSSGAYLIDRDPVYFAVILQYLRGGVLEALAGISLEQLKKEAEFYGLTAMVDILVELPEVQATFTLSDDRIIVWCGQPTHIIHVNFCDNPKLKDFAWQDYALMSALSRSSGLRFRKIAYCGCGHFEIRDPRWLPSRFLCDKRKVLKVIQEVVLCSGYKATVEKTIEKDKEYRCVFEKKAA